MKKLKIVVMRHAKSSWKDSDLSDKERPLKGRGKKAAVDVGARLGRKSLIPDLVLLSDAVRARETWERCWKGMLEFDVDKTVSEPRIVVCPSLYDPGDVSGYLKPFRDNATKDDVLVQVVAHWPGVEEWIRYLVYGESDEVEDVRQVASEKGLVGDREYEESQGGQVPEMKTAFACVLSWKPTKDWEEGDKSTWKDALKSGGWVVERVISPGQEFRGKSGQADGLDLGRSTYYQPSDDEVDDAISASGSWVDPDDA